MASVALEIVQDFPAGADRLWTVFGSRDYVERKYRSLGSTAIDIRRFAATDREIRVDLVRVAPVSAKRIPAWARGLVGGRQSMRHAGVWKRVGPRHIEARLEIRPLGQPVTAAGVGGVDEIAPDRSRLTLRFDVTSRVPGLGTKIAALYATQIEEALAADHAFTLRYLHEAD